MNSATTVRRVLPALAAILALAAVATAQSDDRIRGEYSRTISVSDAPVITVKNLVGDFLIRAGAPNEVRVHASISAGTKWDCDRAKSEARVKNFEANPAVSVQGNSIRIGVWDDMANHHCTSASYTLDVPAGSAVQVETNIGDITVLDVAGPIRVKAGIGQIRVRDPRQSVEAATSTGSIDVTGRPYGNWQLDVGTGGVDLRLPRDAGFHLDAEVQSIHSAIESDFGQRVRLRTTTTKERARMQDDFNGGGPLIKIRTKMGGIRIWER